MHDLYENLEQLCEMVSKEIKDSNKKIDSAGGKISPGDVEYLDKLTHMMKSIKTTMAMMDSEDEGYSGAYPYTNHALMNYNSRDMRGNSYAGRRNARRDSMGRYSGERGYSMDASAMAEDLRDLMQQAPNEHIKGEFRRLIDKVESM